MAEITVDVGVRLKAMQSSVADLQKVLDGLQPNSSGFKTLQKIIADINRDIDRLRIQTSKPFGSQNQFNQTEKTVDKLEESLEKVKITIDRIKFSDLKLDSSQTAQLDNFKQQLKDIKKEFTDFKADLKGQFLDNDFNKAFVEGINPNLINKNFDEIIKNVESRVNSLGSTLAKAKADLENFQNAAKIGEKISKASQTANGVVSPEVMGQEMFDKFFQTNSKGVFSFKTGGGLKKGEIQQQFLEYLTSEFQLSQTQIDQLKNQTASNIRKILAQDDFFNSQKGAAETANKKMSGADSAFTAASKNYENAAAVVARLAPLLSALTNEETSLEDKQKLVNQAIKQFEQDCVNGAKGSKTLQDSTKGLSSGLESFKQQLGQVNAQWLNLQKQQATFNSMKSAIVNFMGFNQVLNLTKKAVKEAMDHIKQLDTVMNGIAIVTDMTTADLWNQVDVYSEMAQRYGTSIQGAYEVSKIYYQAGYETNEVLTLMNETLKLSKISGLDYATTTDYMMTATRGFHMEVSEASKVVDVYSALAANTAVSQQELAEAMTRTASSMESVGTTFEEASAMIATMVATTRESANNIGSAMKSIASRYGELTKDPAKLMDAEGEAMSFNRVDTALKSVGISLQTTDHQFRSFTDVILELSEVWDTLDSVQQRYIATQFAGNRQQSRFLALVSNPDQIRENLEVAAESEDTGTLQALKALDSLETKLNQVQVAYQQFYTTIGVEGIWKTFLDGTKNVIDTLNNLPKLFGKVPVGAIAVIYDIISLIKTVALNGLSEIATIWQNNIQKVTQTDVNTRPVGDKMVDGVLEGIKGRAEEIRTAFSNATDIKNGQGMIERSSEYQSVLENSDIAMVGTIAFNEEDAKFLSSDLDTIISKMLQFNDITEDTGIKLRTALSKGDYKGVAEEIEKISFSLKETGEKLTNIQASSNGFKNLLKNSKHLSSDMAGFASALNMVGTLLNTTSREGQIASGSLMGLSGAFRLSSVAIQAFQGTLNGIPWMAIATGIISIINGISTFIETPTEKIERLTKEAENLNNEAKQVKAEYNTLQRSVDKLEELKEKRYESAEAADEYQSAIDDLASKFPQLVTGFDEAGNIIIDTVSSEAALTEARQKTLQVTLEAAKAEYERRKEETKQSQEVLNRGQSTIENHQEFLRAHDENNTDWIREYINLDLNSPNAGQDVQKLIDSYYNLDENLQDTYSQIVENLQDWVKASEETFNYQDLENSAKKQLLSAQALANKNYSKLGASQAIFTNYLFEQSNIIDENGIALTVFNEKEKDYYDALEKANIDLVNGGERYDKYIQMMNNLNQYSITDWGAFFENSTDNEAYLAIVDYYKSVYHFSDNLKNKILTSFSAERIDENDGVKIVFDTEKNNNIRISELYSAVNEQKEKISGDLYNWILSQIDVIKSFGQQGYIKAGNTLTNQISTILTEDLGHMEEEEASLVFAILKQYDISTIEGLAKAKQALQDANVGEELFDNFDEIEKELIYNIPLAIQSYTQDLVSNVNTIGEKMKKASSGFDGNEALDVLDSLQASGYENFTLADFSMEKNGKFVIKNQEMRQAYFNSLLKEQEAISEALDKRLDNLKNDDVKKNLDSLVKDASKTENHIIDKESLGDYESIFRSLGWLEETTDGQLKLTEEFASQVRDGGLNLLEALDKWLAGALKNSVATEEFLQKTLPAEEALSAGDYQTYLRTLTGNNLLSLRPQHLEQIAKTGAYGNLDYKTEIKPLKDKINSVYNNLISDALSKGLDNIRPEDYEGLIDDSFNAGEEGPHRYEEFVKRYANLAGKSIEETNALIIQAIEKDTQTTTGAAAEAIGKIQWLSSEGKGFAALKDIQTLADALGISVDKILGEYNNQLDMYLVDLSNVEGIDLSEIDGFSDTVKDSINAFLKQIFENVNKAITGKLSNTDVTTLTGQLEQLGLKNLTLDFTETVDGLKLSQRSAIELYNELKKIDALQAQLVFDELAKSLESSNENYANISTVLKRIADLQDEISKMEPGDARLKMYQDELAVAQEIARTRSSTDNKDFDFMNRSLPNGMQNPISYWDSIGEAYKAMNTAAKSGYMEIQDFYNIVQEMNNMAAVSGQSLEFMGQTLSGKAEDAAALIQRGFSALSNIKGDGVKVALNNIGSDFTTGANAMKGDFDTGIRAMADAQIAMLDAAINMLEAIVAMEDIDIDKDGLLEMGEIFEDDGSFNTNVEAWLTKLDTLTGGIEIGGVDLRTALLNMASEGEEGKQKVVELLNQLYNIDWTLGDVNVFAQIQGILQAFYPGENITQGKSIFELLEIPKNVDKNSEEFKKWATDIGLSVDMADLLIQKLALSEGHIADKGSEWYTAIEKMLGLTEKGHEKLKVIFEKFTGDSVDSEELKFWQNIDIEADENGNLTNATYQGSDGGSINLDLDNPLSWAKQIEDYEYALQKARQLGGKIVTTEDNETFTFKTDVGMNEVVVITKGSGENGITTYQFPDWVCNASSMGEALQKYAEYKKNSNSPHYSNMSAGDILVELGYVAKESTKITMQADKPGEDPQSKIDKLLKADKETIEAELKKPENKTINDDGTIDWQINIGGETFKFTSNGQEVSYETLSSQLLEQTGLDTSLIISIATAIKTAFTEDTSIGEAIGTGISNAFSAGNGEDGQPQEVPLPTLTLKPESVTIQLGENEPIIEGTEESQDISIAEVTLKPTTILVNTDGATLSTEGETAPEIDVEGKIISYTDNDSNTDNLTVAKALEGIVTAYTDNGTASTTALAKITGLSAIITSYIEGASPTVEQAAINGLTAVITLYQDGGISDPDDLVAGLSAVVETFTSGKNTPNDLVNNLQALITSYSDANATGKPDIIEGIIAYISSYQPKEGVSAPDVDITGKVTTNYDEIKAQIEKDPIKIQAILDDPDLNQRPSYMGGSQGATTYGQNSGSTTSQSVSIDLSGVASQIKAIQTAQDSIKTDKVEAIQTEQNKIAADKVTAIQTEQEKIESSNVTAIQTAQNQIRSDRVESIKTAASLIDASHIQAVKRAIDSISGTLSVTLKVALDTSGMAPAKGTLGNISTFGSWKGNTIGNNANYHYSHSYAKGTLMGELGPELVVSNGHYFVVGQNGPEMVNLAEDAIVFNHLQTASLLNKGKTKGHGRPVTNERKATSMATGNLEGPAMASAEQALETLRQLRAMWESLRGASLRDLGSLAGSGGAGGGGGSGSGDSADVGSVVKQVERWYNWLQKIEQSQQKINKLTKEYNLLEKQHASSSELAVNLQERYNELVEQRATRQQLAQEQTAARQEMQERLNNSAFSAFYHANDDGSITLTDDAAFQRFIRGRRVKGKVWTQKTLTKAEAKQKNKENDEWNEAHRSEIEAGTAKERKTDYQSGDIVKDKKKVFKKPKSGLELMAELQRTDAAGNNIYSAKEQFKILKDLGFEDFMRDQADGTRIEGSDAESLKQAVENFYERIETDKAEFESLTQSIQEQEDAALDDSLALLEINEQLEELANVPAGIVEGLEKWHDLTRAIARQQEKINILNQQFSRLQNDNKINGEKIFENLQKQRAELKKQLKLNKQLLAERRAAYDERINNLTDLQQDFFTVNEEGQLNYRQNKKKKKKVKITDRQILRDSEGNPITDEQGMVQYRESRRSVNIATSGQQLIDELTRQNEDGTAAYTAEQQFEILRQLGYAQAMMYDSEGNRLFSSADTATREEQESAVREFLEEIQGFSTTMDEEIDAIHELDSAIEDGTTALQQVEQQIRENEMNVENQVLEALKNQRQQEIDESKKNRDAIKEATDRFVDGLQEQLDKEKQLYEQQENQQELDEMRRRLALLQRSGGSASEIRDLQKRISEQEKDMYFEQRQEQIDAIKEASEAELEKLDRQIEIQENLLDFQIANGLLWDEVREIMAGGFDNIFSFITEFSSEFQSASVLGQESLAEQIGDAIAEYVAGTPEALQEAVQNGLNDYQAISGKRQKGTLISRLNMSEEEAAQISTNAQSAYQEAFTQARNQGQSIEEASASAREAANKVYAEAMWNQTYNSQFSGLINNLGLNNNQAKTLTKNAKKSFIDEYLQKFKVGNPGAALTEATTAAKKVIAEKALSLTSIVSATGSEAHREEITRENERIDLIDSRLLELKRKKSTQGLTSAESRELAQLTEERRTRQARINQWRNDPTYSSLTVEDLTAQGYSADRVEQARQEWLNQYMDSATGEVDQERITAIATQNKSFDATLKKGKWPLYDATTLKKTNKTIGNENNTTDLKIKGYKEKDGSYYLLTNKSTKYLALSDFKNQSTIKGYIDNKRLKKYKQGGLIDYTGLAWVDGSKTKPESILSAEQTELLRHSLLDNQYSMASLVATAQESLHNLANSNIYNSIDENSGITIEKLEFTMNVPSIANDYDARRAGQQAFNEMINIARKTGNRILSRR